jgi:adenylate cyclase
VNPDLRRLIVRHRHVAPMVSALLAGTDARVRIVNADGEVVLDRQTGVTDGAGVRAPIQVEGRVLGWVEGGRVAAAVAAVLSYASAREADKRSLSAEALERYRELNLIYDLAQTIGAELNVDAVSRVAVGEANRLPGGGRGFVLLAEGTVGEGTPLHDQLQGEVAIPDAQGGTGIVGAVALGEPEIVNAVPDDPRSTTSERAFASLIVAPLRVRGARLGVVGAASREPVEYRAADLKVLTAIAALAGPAVDQCRSHEAAMRHAEDAGIPADVAATRP